jgi:drug/metabolite transporter (DMT)-like permease
MPVSSTAVPGGEGFARASHSAGKRLNIGIYCALGGAALFGASTPFAKLLLGQIPPIALAGLLYAGSGLGLALWLVLRRAIAPGIDRARFSKGDYKWLAGALLSGGVLGPVLLLYGLAAAPASTTALLLNLEGAFTALLAWFVFREHFDLRVMLGMSLVVVGGIVLTWRPAGAVLAWPALAIAGACLCWAIDNNLTRRISAGDSVKIAAVKGLIAGAVNLGLAFSLGLAIPGGNLALASGLVGALGYGVSLVLFVVALRHLGTARTGAYFSTSPFIGAACSLVLLGERPDNAFWGAATLMAAGIVLHLTERHRHLHGHDALKHVHAHSHDEHHRHAHALGGNGAEPHSHEHQHDPLTHSHPHYPDIHHRHSH